MNIARRSLLKVPAAVLVGAATIGKITDALAQSASVALPEKLEPFRELLDTSEGMTAELLQEYPFGSSSYFVIAQSNPMGEGEPIVIRSRSGAEPVIIEDFRGLPLAVSGNSSEASGPSEQSGPDVELDRFELDPEALVAFKKAPTEAASAALDADLAAMALQQRGRLDSANARGTNRGRLACAWAVNTVARLALGAEIGGGLATANMVKVLAARHMKVPESKVTPGTIVISPTTYSGNRANVGHVGIVGEDGTIFSNSSNQHKWVQNFTLQSWRDHYEGRKRLSVQFYRLDDIYF